MIWIEDGMDVPQELVDAKDAVKWQLLALPGVTGISIGLRETQTEVTDDLTVRIAVEDISQVPAELPEQIGGVDVCVIERVPQPCGLPDGTRYTDVCGGIKISNSNGSGTLGALVKDIQTGGAVGLTNYHVAGDPGQAFPDDIFQPDAPLQVVGNPPSHDDELGGVIRVDFPSTTVTPSLTAGKSDSALVDLTSGVQQGRRLVASIVDSAPGVDLVSAVTGTASISPDKLSRVRKRGFTTGVTRGYALSVSGDWIWRIPGKSGVLSEQLEIFGDPGQPFALDGDSGSLLLLENDATAVGLLWGNNKQGTFGSAGMIGFASAIANVEAALNISVVL